MLQYFLQIITKFKDFIALTILVIFSLVLITYGDVSRIGGFRSIIVGTAGWLQEAFAWIPNPQALKSENRALRELNLQLSTEATRMRLALIENNKLRSMLALKDSVDLALVSANVVGENTIQLRNFLTLDKGEESGIKEGMAVRTDAGLVGNIIITSGNYSLVESLMNPNIRVAGEIVRTGLNGIVVWDGEDKLLLKNIPESYDVQVGDVVITSNFSTKYPEEIPIGQIKTAERDNSTLFMNILIEPYASFKSIDQVFIIKELPDPERLELLKEVEEMIRISKD